MPVLKKIIAKDEELNRVQDAVKVAYDGLTAVPFTQNQTVTATLPSATNTEIPHSLGRVPNGFIVLDKTAAADIYRVSWTSTVITLRSTALVTGVKILLF